MYLTKLDHALWVARWRVDLLGNLDLVAVAVGSRHVHKRLKHEITIMLST